MADTPFSKRYGYAPRAEHITIREDAPMALRKFVVYAASQNFYPLGMKLASADVLNVPTSGLSGSDVAERCEAERLIEQKAPWYRVYDIIERIWSGIGEM